MEQVRPVVTVRGPDGVVVAPLDVLGEEPPVRRSPWGAVALVVVLLLAGSLSWWQDRHRDAAVGAREDAVVALVLTQRFGFRESLGPRLSSRASLLVLDLELRNDGPRPVRVDRAVVGDFRFLGRLDLDPAETVVLQLVRTVTCPDRAEPPLDPVAEGLRLRVVTRAGVRSVLVSPGTLPLDRLRTAGRRACGYLPIAEVVDVTARAGWPTGDRVPVTLELSNASPRRLHLVELQLAPGLRRFGRAGLPAPVGGSSTGQEPALSRLRLWVTPDCRDAPRAPGGALLPLPPDPVRVFVDDDHLTGAGPLRPAEGDLSRLHETYERACS